MKHIDLHTITRPILYVIHTSILLCLTLLLPTACNSKSNTSHCNEQSITVKYAKGFTLSQGNGYRRIDIIDPWDTTQLLSTYLLIDRNDTTPSGLPKGEIIRTPLSKSVIFSSVHCSLLNELNALDAIAGICDSEYNYVEALQKRLTEGTLTDAGSSVTPDIERIIELSPDAILLSPFENTQNDRLIHTGIPIIECADYMETSPLGRAEWVRVFGWLYGCETSADSLFSHVEQSYLSTCDLISHTTTRPKVITERRTGAVWYIPGGNSYMATLLRDAGASYPWNDNQNTGSIPLSFENVFERGQDADYWLIKYHAPADITYSDLQQEYTPYSSFKAFQQQQIYGCNTQRLRYYEETPFHPERLLQDLGAIFHPTLFENYIPYYFHPMPL